MTTHCAGTLLLWRASVNKAKYNSKQDVQSNKQSSKNHKAKQTKSRNPPAKTRLTKAESNRKNSLNSTGPKTPRGKSFSRYNAVKHRLYSKELFITEADKAEYDEMREGLITDLTPTTTLECL